jgi:endonuclease YncB( thermonuclease family)
MRPCAEGCQPVSGGAKTGKATYNRCVAVSYLDGIDIEAEMVRTGPARDCPRYSGVCHADAERAAAADGATIAAT